MLGIPEWLAVGLLVLCIVGISWITHLAVRPHLHAWRYERAIRRYFRNLS
jgi:hypothetical protein